MTEGKLNYIRLKLSYLVGVDHRQNSSQWKNTVQFLGSI